MFMMLLFLLVGMFLGGEEPAAAGTNDEALGVSGW
jgi:hypothetical protein